MVDDQWKARRRRNPAQAARIDPSETLIDDFELLQQVVNESGGDPGMELGPDLVLFMGEKLVVCSPKQMWDWEVQDYGRPRIEFQGNGYYLSRKLSGDEDRPYRYELAPWPVRLRASQRQTIVYDEGYVTNRDGRFKKVKSQTGRRSRMTFLYPFLGFAWSGTKRDFLEPHGFNAVRISLMSCILAYAIFLTELVSFFFFSTGMLQWMIGSALLVVDYCCLLVLPVDAAIRFFQIVNGTSRYPDGFLEWVLNFVLQKREERIAEMEEERDRFGR